MWACPLSQRRHSFASVSSVLPTASATAGSAGPHSSSGTVAGAIQRRSGGGRLRRKTAVVLNTKKNTWRVKKKGKAAPTVAATTSASSSSSAAAAGGTAVGASGSASGSRRVSSASGTTGSGSGVAAASASSSAAARVKQRAGRMQRVGRPVVQKKSVGIAAAASPPLRRQLKVGRRVSGKSAGSTSTTAAGKSKKSSSSTAASPPRSRRSKKLRICVLSSSYVGADSATASVDNFWCTPQHYVKAGKKQYSFSDVQMMKSDSYKVIRELVTSGKYDVFFNLCDGGRDEKRAGVDVVQALEEHNAAFTGTDSRSFEPSKIDMKLMVGSSGVKVPNFVLLDTDDALAKKCRHLKFPVIVKHLSGYASVGINKDNRCDTLDQLKHKVRLFLKEYNHALIEEFIRGREGTVLTCADTASLHGVKVFKPLMFYFLQGGDDFAYFEKKWTMECNEEAYGFLPTSDPAYSAIIDMARNAFRYIMNGVGYGRVDFRIDERTGEPYFLEINPNCGMWYSPKDGGDFADVMVAGDTHWDHERFIANAVSRAVKEQTARRPWYFISHDRHGHFSTRASKTVAAGKCLYGDAIHPIPVVAKALYKLGDPEPTVGCVVCRGDGIQQSVALRHSCEPNMQFVHGKTLLFAAKRQINVGEELTVDYATLRDEAMPHFVCACGTKNCRSIIFPMPAMPRTVEAKTMKKLLREKKRVWLQEKANREAERILKSRSSSASSSASSPVSASSSSSPSSSSGSTAGAASGSGVHGSGSAPGGSSHSPHHHSSAGNSGGSSTSK